MRVYRKRPDPQYRISGNTGGLVQITGKMAGCITPTPGMIIFYDWYGKNFPDHVGIVEYVEDGIVHTVAGNSSDSVRQRQYPVGDSRILGYGWILE